jgi:hypothetical protein
MSLKLVVGVLVVFYAAVVFAAPPGKQGMIILLQ